MIRRHKILKSNQAMREGVIDGPRRLEDGEVAFRVPTEDMKALVLLYPDLMSHDHAVKHQAWKKLRHSPIGEKYLVTRTPRRVLQS